VQPEFIILQLLVIHLEVRILFQVHLEVQADRLHLGVRADRLEVQVDLLHLEVQSEEDKINYKNKSRQLTAFIYFDY